MSWPIKALSEVCDIQMGSAPKGETYVELNKGIPLIAGAADYGEVFPRPKKATISPTKLCQKGDLIICVRATIGDLNWADKEYCLGRGVAGLRPKEELLAKYLFYFIKASEKELYKNATGSTFLQINRAIIEQIEIPLPPLPIQKKIAAVLEKADKLRQQSQQMERELNLLAQSVFLDMFGDPGINPRKWPLRPIGSTFKSLTDYHANGSYEILRSHVELFDEPNYALMVRTTDLEKNNFSQNVKYISKDAYYFLNKTKVFGNELVVNKIGSAGKVYLMPKLDRPVSLAMNQFMVRLKEDIVLPEFMYYLLTSKFGEREIQAHVKGAVTKTITKDALRSVELPIPPLELQQKFVSTLLHLKGLIRCSSDNNICKDELFSSLMQRAFKGELDLKGVA